MWFLQCSSLCAICEEESCEIDHEFDKNVEVDEIADNVEN